MDNLNISCFSTPSAEAFAEIRVKVSRHLQANGAESRLPHANQIWMLAGFALFEGLSKRWECIEVYPQAIMHRLEASATYKRRCGGAQLQLQALSRFTRWPSTSDPDGVSQLRILTGSPAHDAVDAYASAWLAALDEKRRDALGHPPDDVIWVPSRAYLEQLRT